MKWLLVAIDHGPSQTLEPLAASPDFYKFEYSDFNVLTCNWSGYLQNNFVDGVIVGTSRSDLGFKCESDCRVAATKLCLPIVVIEDFPGNYQTVGGANTDLLFIEDISLKDSLYGEAGFDILAGSTIRYDPLRRIVHEIRKKYYSSLANSNARKKILWIGQPETEECLRTLSNLMPDLVALGCDLMFKAHPRDIGYQQGDYQDLLDGCGLSVVDVTEYSVDASLALAPNFVVTQFSSVAVEASFYGIPSCYVLYPEVGGKLLFEMCGYTIPPICQSGGSVLIDCCDDQKEILEKILFDCEYRGEIIEKFDVYYETFDLVANSVLKNIDNIVGFDR